MKRFFLGLGLSIVILISFSFVILRLLANGPEDNFFNTNYRAKFATQPILRQLLGLHFDGDARADYLSDRFDKIILEIDVMQGLEISDRAVDLLRTKIEETTGKQVLIALSGTVPYENRVSNEDFKELIEQYKNYSNQNSAKIYLLYLSEFLDNSDRLGTTFNVDTIILFDSALTSFTAQNPETLDYYVESTALHEFGHQLGLPHNDQPNCLMAAQAEHSGYGIESLSDIIIDFCEYEKDLIRAQ